MSGKVGQSTQLVSGIEVSENMRETIFKSQAAYYKQKEAQLKDAIRHKNKGSIKLVKNND